MSGQLLTTMVPCCSLCGEPMKLFPNCAVVGLPGQWMASTEYDMPIFVPDPDIQLTVVSLPNGQLAFVMNGKEPELHIHDDCFEQMSDEFLYGPTDDPDNDDYYYYIERYANGGTD